MATKGVEIFDFNEVQALHRALMEAKFAENPVDTAVCGSPFVAAVANRVVDTLIEMERHSGGDERARHWEEWRQVTPSRREWKVALSRVEPGGPWSSWSVEEKRRFAELLLSPLRATDQLLDQFVREADVRAGR